MRILRLRNVDPIYRDLQSGQQKQYTIFEHKVVCTESLNLNKEPMVFLLVKINLNWTFGTCFLSKQATYLIAKMSHKR